MRSTVLCRTGTSIARADTIAHSSSCLQPIKLLAPHQAWRLADEIVRQSGAHTFSAFIGNMPVMLRTRFCHLMRSEILQEDPAAWGECQFDQGGYFIINGAEKVVIAQVLLSALGPLCHRLLVAR